MHKDGKETEMRMVEEMCGTFAQAADTFKITDKCGNLVDVIKAGETVVHGSFKLVTKDQIARVIGIVTASMCNAQNDDGEDVYKFQCNGWEPEGRVGNILLQDVENEVDRWACGQDLFGGTGWVGTVQEDGSVIYAKPGKPLLALEIPEGTVVDSLEGSRTADAGCMLAITNAKRGDFYVWTPDVVEEYVKPFAG